MQTRMQKTKEEKMEENMKKKAGGGRTDSKRCFKNGIYDFKN